MSQRAAERGWRTIDLGPEHAAEALVRQLVRHQSSTTTISPQASASILGIGGSLGGITSSKTTTYDIVDLPVILLEACKKEKKGLFVSIDEVQKVGLDEMSSICNAFQLASRKGNDIILAVAGLPYAYEQVIHEEGCTFLRRGAHEELGLLTWDEVIDAFSESLQLVKGLVVEQSSLEALARASLGHPYMIQLLGYYLVAVINEQEARGGYEATSEAVGQASAMALQTYRGRALKPQVDELSSVERDYLRGMVAVMGDDHVAESSKVADYLGKRPAALTRARDKLLRNGIIVAPQRGHVRFAIPYLRDYIADVGQADSAARLIESWDV